jgi:hypothetical protein
MRNRDRSAAGAGGSQNYARFYGVQRTMQQNRFRATDQADVWCCSAEECHYVR